jgi:hypothetical protein
MRECGDCTRCCEGWLFINEDGIVANPEQQCQHLTTNDKCTIYSSRPRICREFECAWLVDPLVPEWLIPSISSIILTQKKPNDYHAYFDKDLILNILEKVGQNTQENFHLVQKIFTKYKVTHCNKNNYRYIDDQWQYGHNKIIKIIKES